MAERSSIALSGAPGSPYTRKMLAVLRYRHIPYRFMTLSAAKAQGMPQAKVPLLPTFYLPDPSGEIEAVTDSSPLIRRFERDYTGRSIIPADPAAAFIDMLLEDYADEWLTKAMFHYRWVYAADIKQAAEVLPHWRNAAQSDAAIADQSRAFAERQIGRLGFVGSNAKTGPVIEQSNTRFVDLLNAHLKAHHFLMGRRPGSSDFAMFGQLTQLAQFDPTPMALTLARSPRVYAWSATMEDMSGLEPTKADWLTAATLPPTIKDILREVARTYLPVMLANARALQSGAQQVETTVDGKPWVQSPFPYQAKCLRSLREAHQALDVPSRRTIDAVLSEAGLGSLVGG